MKSTTVFIILSFYITVSYAQNITNSLGSAGTFTVEDDGGTDMLTINNSGTIVNHLGTGTTFSIQDAGANNLFYVEESGNTTSTVSSAGFNIDDDAGNQLVNIRYDFEPKVEIGDHSSVSSSRQLSIVREGGTAGLALYSFLSTGFSSFNKVEMHHARGTAASPAALHFSDELGQLTWFGKGSGSTQLSATMFVNCGESPQDGSTGAVSTSRVPSHIVFGASNTSGTYNTIFSINGDGTIQVPALTSVTDLQTDANGVLIDGASDKRLKTNINPMNYGLEEVLRLKPVTFNWIPSENMTTQLQHGFIAQEVEEIFPELVGERNDGFKTLSYKTLVPVLTKAIQEQQDEIEKLEAELIRVNTEMDERLAKLEKSIDKLSKKEQRRLAKK